MDNIMNELDAIFRMANILRLLNILKTALTVGIIAFTVFSISGIFLAKE